MNDTRGSLSDNLRSEDSHTVTSICTGVGDKFLWIKFEQMMTSKRRASWMIRVVYKVGLIPSPLYSDVFTEKKK
ncbi:hypothetical protein A9G09_07525 [Gilliamella sp. wkB292]|nr:hypothetical protein A9G09_07525 [Gilliamella apicola]